jgi:Flp pilus assembly pilin Flp
MQALIVRYVCVLSQSLRGERALSREDGQAMIEYALILGLVVTGAVTILQLMGASVSSLLSEVQASFP